MSRVLRLLAPFMFLAGNYLARPCSAVLNTDVGETPLLLDAVIPEGNGSISGRNYRSRRRLIGGHRQYSVEPLFEPLTRAGFAWFSISYRLATDLLQFGVAVEDVQTAIRFVREHAQQYNIDPTDRLAGRIRRRPLASLAVERSPKSVSAVVAIYPPTDLVSLAHNSRPYPNQSGRSSGRRVWSNSSSGISGKCRRSSMSGQSCRHSFSSTEQRTASCHTISQTGCSTSSSGGDAADLMTVQGGGHGLRGWERSKQISGYRQKMIDWLATKLAPGRVLAARASR